jgi:DNA repair protein RecN (Recombination protein N)
MLEELSVQNYALIDKVALSFEKGLNILTGETGAGKSIIVGAIGFLLGSKAGAEIVRSGADEASVSATMHIEAGNTPIRDWLAARGIETEDERILVRRTVKTSGRGAIYLQNTPLSRTELDECMALLFDIHGQHEHEGLLRRETHRKYLDRFAGIENETLDFNRVFLELSAKRKSMEEGRLSGRQRAERGEMLRFAVDEINAAQPLSGESEKLEIEAARLASIEKLNNLTREAAAALYDDEASVLHSGRKIRSLLDNAAGIDRSIEVLAKRAAALFYEAEDMAGELRSYIGKLSFDDGRLDELEERLTLLGKLRKKYAGKAAGAAQQSNTAQSEINFGASSEDAILAYRNQALAELEGLGSIEENREQLAAEITALEKDIGRRAAALSAKRAAAGKRLAVEICGILQSLGMKAARFSVRLADKNSGAGGLTLGPWGKDEVEFLFSANAGEAERELARIASGGELSRVMLAIKTVLAAGDNVETLVFDEIDTGIGGEVALSIGEYLAKIGKHCQILCITHLASIAVRADHHLKVEKRTENERTLTSVSALLPAQRRLEIARMLAGDTGQKALAHADELLARYGATRPYPR